MQTGTLTRTQQDRMPWPVGMYWLRAQQAKAPDEVYRSAEGIVRCITALLLADVLDATWSDDLTLALRGGPEKRALEKPGFGSRIALLRLLVRAHEGLEGGILSPLQDWWKAVDGPKGPLQALVEARNRVAHGAATTGVAQVAQARRDAVGLLAAVLRPASFLRDVQVVHLEGALRTQRGKQVGLLRRLNGPAPYLALAAEAEWPRGFALEDERVYMGTPDGRRWKLFPFLHLEAGDAASSGHPRPTVFDTVDRRGRMRFLDPITGRDDVAATLPNAEWEPSDWFSFLDGRQATASGWRQSLDAPHAALVFESRADLSDGLRAGAVLEGMRLVQKLGEGGAAAVWEVEDVDDGSSHALKVLKPEMTENEVEAKRFEQEVTTMKRLYRSGCRRVIGPIEAFRTMDGDVRRLIVRMPLMASTLKDAAAELRAASGGVPPDDAQVRDWLRQGLEALAELHGQKVVHRDIKPSNFLMDSDGRLFVSDLGVARDNGRKEALTRTGDIVGTDIYMAPEQRVGSRDIGPAVDVYALAVSVDELIHGMPRAMAGKGVEGALGSLIRAMGHMDADQRPTAVGALAQLDAIEASSASTVAVQQGRDGTVTAQSVVEAPVAAVASVVALAPPLAVMASPRADAPAELREAATSPAPAASGKGVLWGGVAMLALIAAGGYVALAPAPDAGEAQAPTSTPVTPEVPVVALPAPTSALTTQAPAVARPAASNVSRPSAVAIGASAAPTLPPVAPVVAAATPVVPVAAVSDVPAASVVVAVRPKVTAADFPESAMLLSVSQGRCTVSFTVDATGVPTQATVRDCTAGFETTFPGWARRHRFAPPGGVAGPFRFDMDLTMRVPK